MARIRTVKPEFWTDPFMVQLPPMGRLMFVALISSADDHGYISDEPDRIALEVMPREDPDVVDDWIQFFEASGKIDRFVAPEGNNYLRIHNWEKHQRVDRPSNSKIAREGSRKLAIPNEARRSVATRYGCPPGGDIYAGCYYCGQEGRVHWHTLHSGRPSAWVTFPGLELDHLESSDSGGENSPENIVLACRRCNRSKGTQPWVDALTAGVFSEPSRGFASPREDSTPDQGSGSRDQGGDQGSEEQGGETPCAPAGAPSGANGGGHRFEEWWQQYPQHRRKDKKRCREIWIRKRLDERADELLLDVYRRQHHDQDWLDDFIPLPKTYLNGDKWEDEMRPARAGKGNGETIKERAARIAAETPKGQTYDG